jgi:hyperosmotically inducible protein
MTTTILRAAVAAAAAMLALSACHREAGEQSVGQRLDTAIDRTQQKLNEAGEKTQQKLSEAGEKAEQKLAEAGNKIAATTDTAVASVKEAATPKPSGEGGKPMSDTAITASIKADFLKDPDLSVLKIDVDTRNGVVTLNGLAADEPARGRAEKIAGAIKGVKEVRNFLVIKRA